MLRYDVGYSKTTAGSNAAYDPCLLSHVPVMITYDFTKVKKPVLLLAGPATIPVYTFVYRTIHKHL